MERCPNNLYFCEVENPTSKLLGVSWNRNNQAWLAQLQYNEKRYCCGLFDFEEHARNYINCKCDALGIPHQSPNPTIEQKWKVQLIHNNNIYYDGVFNDKKNAVISANLLCDKCEIECKNLTIYTEPNVIQRVIYPLCIAQGYIILVNCKFCFFHFF